MTTIHPAPSTTLASGMTATGTRTASGAGRGWVPHRVWDRRALRDIGLDDVVIFAEGDEHQPFARWNGDDLDERLL